MASRLGGWLIAAAAAIVILGASIAPFLLPPVVRFEQDRVGVAALAQNGLPSGMSPSQRDQATQSLLADLVLWRGDFTVTVSRFELLSPEERAHMVDVRRVFTSFWALVFASVIVVAVGFRRARGKEARAAAWRAVRNGARALAVAIAVLGAIAVVAFDVAFEVFHRIFFAPGTYNFDPARSALLALFPDQFWSEIAIAVAIVTLLAALVMAWGAGRRAKHAAPNANASAFTATMAGA